MSQLTLDNDFREPAFLKKQSTLNSTLIGLFYDPQGHLPLGEVEVV